MGFLLKGSGVVEDTMGLHSRDVRPLLREGRGYMEVAMGIWIRVGGYRKRQ